MTHYDVVFVPSGVKGASLFGAPHAPVPGCGWCAEHGIHAAGWCPGCDAKFGVGSRKGGGVLADIALDMTMQRPNAIVLAADRARIHAGADRLVYALLEEARLHHASKAADPVWRAARIGGWDTWRAAGLSWVLGVTPKHPWSYPTGLDTRSTDLVAAYDIGRIAEARGWGRVVVASEGALGNEAATIEARDNEDEDGPVFTWFGDVLQLDGKDVVVNGCGASVTDDYAGLGGFTLCIRGHFGGKVVYAKETQARGRAACIRAAKRVVEKMAREHLENRSKTS